MPLFSVVVPVYNVEKYLSQCIESVLEQTYTDFELILVDDGSPDNCGTICNEYAAKDSRIRVIHKVNRGVTSARLAGAQISISTYIVCVDGDDWIAPDYLEKLSKEATNANSDIICAGMILAYSDKQTEKAIAFSQGCYNRAEIEEKLFPHLIQNANAEYFPPAIWAKAIKREIYLPMQLAVDQRIKIGEDGACTIPCIYRAHSLSILPDCLYYYRQNEASMTKNRKAFPWSGPMLIAEHLAQQIDCKQFDFQQQMYRKTAHELFSVVVSQFNRKEAYRTVKQDILLNLNTPIYREAIENAFFSDIRGKAMLFAMKHRVLWLIWLWNRVKRVNA